MRWDEMKMAEEEGRRTAQRTEAARLQHEQFKKDIEKIRKECREMRDP